MNTTSYTNEDVEIADIIGGWCCPDEIGEPTIRNEYPRDILNNCYDSTDSDSYSNDGSDTSVEPFCHTPSVRSESERREHNRVPKVDPNKHVNFNKNHESESVRMDPYDFLYYTKKEFYDYYGTNYIWKMAHPKRTYQKNLIWDCVSYSKKLGLTDDMMKYIIRSTTKI